MATNTKMRIFSTAGLALLAAGLACCGGNSTKPGVVVSPATQTVLVGHTQVFSATVTGISTSGVTWEVCLPPTITPPNGTQGQPVDCGAGNLGTVTQMGPNGSEALYSAPPTVPTPALINVVAVSTIDNTVFGASAVTIVSGISLQISPLSATVTTYQAATPTNSQVTFTATLTGAGANQTGLTWSVNNPVQNGPPPNGTITPTSGNQALYQAPATIPSGTVTVTVTSAADPSKSASATVSITAPTAPTLTSIDPTIAAEGSAQQDVYVIGSGFISGDVVTANGTAVPTTFISGLLLRGTLPSTFFQQPGVVSLEVSRNLSGVTQPATLTVKPVRPAVVASAPQTTSPNVSAANILLTGGFFSPGTSVVSFNGAGPSGGVTTTYTSSRQLTATVPQNSLGTPGLYPLIVQNQDAQKAGVPSVSSVNLAIQPLPSQIPTAATVSGIPVGAAPTAIAVDHATGLAYIANSGDGSVSVVNLNTNTFVTTITGVGTKLTGIAVDDMLSPHYAYAVDSASNTVVPINLTTNTTLAPVALPSVTIPISIGVNPITHRAVIANQLTDLATMLDTSGGSPVLLPQIGGTNSAYSSGQNPQVAIDPRLNWAVVTPGVAGVINLVDLGRNPIPGVDPGRPAQVIGTLTLTATGTAEGVGINPETHTAFFADPESNTLTIFSLLNNSVTSVTLTGGYDASAATGLSNIGIAVNGNAGTAAIVDLSTGNILQSSVAVGSNPQAVAIDPATNEAVVANQSANSVSIVSLGSIRNLHIVETSPNLTFTSTAPQQITIVGYGFAANSQVLLDGVALPAGDVLFQNNRELIATIPASDLALPRRFTITVQTPGAAAPNLMSNAADLYVIGQVAVGTSPTGVAVDTDLDLALVTNSGDGTASLVNLDSGTLAVTPNQPNPITVGTNPQGVAVIPRLGLGVVANAGSNDVTLVDLTGTNAPNTIPNCSNCNQPNGVAINPDTAIAVISNSGANASNEYNYSYFAVDNAGPAVAPGAQLDQAPSAVAIDPNLNYAAIGTESQDSSVDIVNLADQQLTKSVSLTTGANPGLPTGAVFDSLNQVFLVANRQANNVAIIDPSTFIVTPINAGIDPNSLDYDFQTSTLITANQASNSLSVLDYICPPTGISTTCTGPQVRSVLGLAASNQFSVAIHPILDMVVLVDTANNRVLLVPEPH
ncbi:MAG: hypothetical protein WAL51_11510 [Candidatus Acidiferrales bacterium]